MEGCGGLLLPIIGVRAAPHSTMRAWVPEAAACAYASCPMKMTIGLECIIVQARLRVSMVLGCKVRHRGCTTA